MYGRGAFHVVALLLVALVGSALAQGGTQLLFTSPGMHALGGTSAPNVALLLTGAFTPGGTQDVYGFDYNGTLTAPAGRSSYGAAILPTMNRAASGTHPDFAALRVFSPTVGGGGANLTNASGIKIEGAPSGATNNYALWVAAGNTRLEGMLRVTGDAQIDGNISAKYQDVAEWVPSAHALAAATVARIDSSASNRVVISDKPYDTRVAGVVSTQPGVLLGEGGADKTKLAHS